MIPAEPRHKSDCMASVIASLLELPIDDVPDFWVGDDRPNPAARQYEAVRAWLVDQGYHLYYSSAVSPRHLTTFRSEKFEPGCSWPPRGYWIGAVARVEWLRDREPYHVVVMEGRRCVFNPSGSVKQTHEPDVWLVAYYLLIPLDPAA